MSLNWLFNVKLIKIKIEIIIRRTIRLFMMFFLLHNSLIRKLNFQIIKIMLRRVNLDKIMIIIN